ncbi:MAG: ABC transporter permease [Merdibacter sp.]
MGVILGIISAVRRGKIADNAISVMTLVFISMPSFFLGLLLLLFFSLKLRWLPVYSNGSWNQFVLPVLSLGLVELGYIAHNPPSLLDMSARTTHSLAKGLRKHTVIYRDALKNALIPIITSVGMRFGSLLAGATITETVFSIRGIGSVMLEAINTRDYTLMQSCILVVSLTFIVVNTLTDILYTVVDPRIRLK